MSAPSLALGRWGARCARLWLALLGCALRSLALAPLGCALRSLALAPLGCALHALRAFRWGERSTRLRRAPLG